MTIARNLIDGQWQEALSGNTVPSINPATGESLGSVVNGGKAEAEAAVQAARTGFSKASWSQNPRLRQMTLLRWADNLERNAGALAELLTKTNGKVLASGGRVLNVTARGATLAEAHTRAYAMVDGIDWPQGFCRRDIGWRAL